MWKERNRDTSDSDRKKTQKNANVHGKGENWKRGGPRAQHRDNTNRKSLSTQNGFLKKARWRTLAGEKNTEGQQLPKCAWQSSVSYKKNRQSTPRKALKKGHSSGPKG